MSFIGDTIGKVVGGITGASQQADAASDAANTQAGMSGLAIQKQDEQFKVIQQLLAPFVQAGTGALAGQQNLLGLNGNGAQQNAINALQTSPGFTSLLQAGENSILQNASATGGLRGGNTQNALARFSPQLLNQVIQQQFANLGGLAQTGLGAATGTGTAGQNNANAVSGLLQQQGAALAGGQLAQGNVVSNSMNQAAGIAGSLLGFKF